MRLEHALPGDGQRLCFALGDGDEAPLDPAAQATDAQQQQHVDHAGDAGDRQRAQQLAHVARLLGFADDLLEPADGLLRRHFKVFAGEHIHVVGGDDENEVGAQHHHLPDRVFLHAHLMLAALAQVVGQRTFAASGAHGRGLAKEGTAEGDDVAIKDPQGRALDAARRVRLFCLRPGRNGHANHHQDAQHAPEKPPPHVEHSHLPLFSLFVADAHRIVRRTAKFPIGILAAKPLPRCMAIDVN